MLMQPSSGFVVVLDWQVGPDLSALQSMESGMFCTTLFRQEWVRLTLFGTQTFCRPRQFALKLNIYPDVLAYNNHRCFPFPFTGGQAE